MSDSANPLQAFIDNSKDSQKIWALQDPQTNDWVVCDSAQYDETDVMPVWSLESEAKAYCSDEWADYKAVAISVDDYLEFWVTDLNYDGVLLGLNWQVDEQDSVEVDPIDVAKAFANYESIA